MGHFGQMRSDTATPKHGMRGKNVKNFFLLRTRFRPFWIDLAQKKIFEIFFSKLSRFFEKKIWATPKHAIRETFLKKFLVWETRLIECIWDTNKRRYGSAHLVSTPRPFELWWPIIYQNNRLLEHFEPVEKKIQFLTFFAQNGLKSPQTGPKRPPKWP